VDRRCQVMAGGLALWVRRGDALSLGFALDVAVTALAAGEEVLIALFQAGLAGWVEAHVPEAPRRVAGPDERLIRRRAELGSPPVREAVARCRALGGARFQVLACSGDVERLALDPDELVAQAVIDDALGLPTLWRRSRSLTMLSV